MSPSVRHILAENARLRSAIGHAVDRLEGLTGAPGEDVEAKIAEVRDELAETLGGDHD
jgi:hypothetical protein